MIKKLKDYSIIAVGILAIGVLLLAVLKYLLPVFLPFIIAWAIAMLARTPAERLSRKIKAPSRIIRLMTSLLFTLTGFGVLALLIWQIIGAVWRFLSNFGEGNKLYELIISLTSPKLNIFGDAIPDELKEKISNALSQMLSSALSGLATGVTAWVGAVPGLLFFLLITLISLVYFSLDLERINAFLSSLLPERARKRLSAISEGMMATVKKYLGSYLLICTLTFAIMLLGLLVLGVRGAPLVALIVSLLDILPVIGVGTVLVPWSVFSLATGNHFLGIGLLVLFVINTVVRQFSEPKILGKSLNLHPVATLVMLYAGYSLFGILGILLVPLVSVAIAIILKKNHSSEVA